MSESSGMALGINTEREPHQTRAGSPSIPSGKKLWAMYLMDLRIAKLFLVILGVMLVACTVTLFTGQPMFALTFMPMVVMLFVSNLFGVIEAGQLNQLFGALPVDRRTVVRAHHLAAGTVIGIFALPWLVAIGVHLLAPGVGPRLEASASGLGVVAVMVLLASVNIAAITRWGIRVGAWAAMVVVFCCVGLMVFLSETWDELSMPAPALTALPILVIVVGSWLCYRWTLRTYLRQDH